MTVKLVGSTSGSVSLQAPASTSGGAHRVLTLPDVNGTVATTTTAGKILQVKQAVKTDTSSTTGFGWVTIPGTVSSIAALPVVLAGALIATVPPPPSAVNFN